MASTASGTAVQHALEVAEGNRFRFGENWSRFLRTLSPERIWKAELSLSSMRGFPIQGKRFLDVGSGSGLFSLAARRLGARVHSFDYDPLSVACTAELKRRFFPNDPLWVVEQGSVLDSSYLSALGKFDVVYSWGVLHHTSAMWQAIDNAVKLVADGGTLYVAIYNDQGTQSRRWTKIKRVYNKSARPLQLLLESGVCVASWWRPLTKDLIRLRPFESWRNFSSQRGMSPWWDVVDWVGGYPFEVAKPEEVFDFCQERGLVLRKMRTAGGSLGNNEFEFLKPAIGQEFEPELNSALSRA